MVRRVVKSLPEDTLKLSSIYGNIKGIFAYHSVNGGNSKGCVCILFSFVDGDRSNIRIRKWAFKYLNTPSSEGSYISDSMEESIERAIDAGKEVYHFESAIDFAKWLITKT